MIQNFIDEIYETRTPGIFNILGDGLGDLQECSDSATRDCLLNYIEYCEEQISFAKKLLNGRNINE